jgi:hypothetical protein
LAGEPLTTKLTSGIVDYFVLLQIILFVQVEVWDALLCMLDQFHADIEVKEGFKECVNISFQVMPKSFRKLILWCTISHAHCLTLALLFPVFAVFFEKPQLPMIIVEQTCHIFVG